MYVLIVESMCRSRLSSNLFFFYINESGQFVYLIIWSEWQIVSMHRDKDKRWSRPFSWWSTFTHCLVNSFRPRFCVFGTNNTICQLNPIWADCAYVQRSRTHFHRCVEYTQSTCNLVGTVFVNSFNRIFIFVTYIHFGIGRLFSSKSE